MHVSPPRTCQQSPIQQTRPNANAGNGKGFGVGEKSGKVGSTKRGGHAASSGIVASEISAMALERHSTGGAAAMLPSMSCVSNRSRTYQKECRFNDADSNSQKESKRSLSSGQPGSRKSHTTPTAAISTRDYLNAKTNKSEGTERLGSKQNSGVIGSVLFFGDMEDVDSINRNVSREQMQSEDFLTGNSTPAWIPVRHKSNAINSGSRVVQGKTLATSTSLEATNFENDDIDVVRMIKSLQRSYHEDSIEKIVRDRVSSLLGSEGKRIVRRIDISIITKDCKSVEPCCHTVGFDDSIGKGMQILRLCELLRLEGYNVDVYESLRSKSSKMYRDCLRNLTHSFLGIESHTSNHDCTRDGIENNLLIVDPAFRQQFEIARPSNRYKLVLRALPNTFVGQLKDLQKIVGIVVEEIKRSFELEDMSIPPWRRQDAFLSKWMPMTRFDVKDSVRKNLGGAAKEEKRNLYSKTGNRNNSERNKENEGVGAKVLVHVDMQGVVSSMT